MEAVDCSLRRIVRTSSTEDPGSVDQPRGDFAVFVWFLALAVLFQLARGDMGLIRAWRASPGGSGFGDGLVPQIWFACGVMTLLLPHRVSVLALFTAAGVYDLWWRLPIVTPSIFFHGLVSAQVLLTLFYLALRNASRGLGPRVTPAEFMSAFRASALALLLTLFLFAVLHKFTDTSRDWTAGFFHQIAKYYMPFFPMYSIPRGYYWLLTVGGEALIVALLAFRRTRPLAVLSGIAFACFVGTVVYGFGSIVLATFLALSATGRLFAPITRLAMVTRARNLLSPGTWRLVFAAAICSIFFLDHSSGFTMADRAWAFVPGREPGTFDVLTPMQFAWFAISTPVLISALVAWCRCRSKILDPSPPLRLVVAYALAALLVVSELGIYAGVKTRPNVAMFSGVNVRGAEPNHQLFAARLLTSHFHRDLLIVTTSDGRSIAAPALALRALLDHERRHGAENKLLNQYRNAPIRRLRMGQESTFAFEDLDTVEPTSMLELLLPERLFYLEPEMEDGLMQSMPELFGSPRAK